MQVSYLSRNGSMVHALAMPLAGTLVIQRLDGYLKRWRNTLARSNFLDFMDSELNRKINDLLKCLEENKRLDSDDKRHRAELYEKFMDILHTAAWRDLPKENSWTVMEWEEHVKKEVKEGVKEFRDQLE